MTGPQITLTAWDTHGKPFLRALLREPIHPDTLADLETTLARENVAYSLDDIAAEIGVRLPEPAPAAASAPVVRPRPRRKVRS